MRDHKLPELEITQNLCISFILIMDFGNFLGMEFIYQQREAR